MQAHIYHSGATESYVTRTIANNGNIILDYINLILIFPLNFCSAIVVDSCTADKLQKKKLHRVLLFYRVIQASIFETLHKTSGSYE